MVTIPLAVLLSTMSVTLAAQWPDYRDPRIPRAKDGKPNLTAPAPRLNGRPDLSGLWQAERTLEDHWFAEGAGAEPYYRVAGQLFVDDAQRLDPRPGPRQAAVETMRQQLSQSGNLLLAGYTTGGLEGNTLIGIVDAFAVKLALCPPAKMKQSWRSRRVATAKSITSGMLAR